MNIFKPTHIEKYCCLDNKDLTYNELYLKYKDNYTYIYKIICTCSNEKFKVYKDNHPSVYIECSHCSNKIIVYDLDFYLASRKLDKHLEKYQLIFEDLEYFEVYAIYEYSDEYLCENDVEFNQNDIDWAKVYIKNNNLIIKILDDETS